MARSGEFEMIAKYFTFAPKANGWKSEGAGDDCALIDLAGARIAVTADMMALTTHFLADCPPRRVGWKAAAVNLSDLAAAGAEPKAMFLTIGLPDRNDEWLEGFSRGFREALDRYGASLLGGDTTRTPLTSDGTHSPTAISITAMGELAPGTGLTRKGARPGDDVWVSGTPGDAYAALMMRIGGWKVAEPFREYLIDRMELPTPRVELGMQLIGAASAAADVSDGLIQDLGHIFERSMVKGRIDVDAVPASAALMSLSPEKRREAALAGGDDYELVFTAPKELAGTIEQLSIMLGVRLTKIGEVQARVESEDEALVELVDSNGDAVAFEKPGFDHFKA